MRSLWSGGSAEGVLRRIDRRRRFLFGVDLAVACLCLAAVLLVPWRSRGPEPTAVATTFADGSLAQPVTRDSEVRVEQDGADRTVARLTGGARFQVVHNPERTFEVRAGDVRVRVLGTTFSVQQLPSGQAQVLVERGRVEVAWLGGSAVLMTGQGGVFPPTEGLEADVEADDAGPTASPPPSPTPRGPAHVSPSGGAWREYARAGQYAKAHDDLHAHGPEAVRDEAADLMLAADVARLSAHPAEAVGPLRLVCERHPGDRRAPVAAFTLGRVLLDDLGQPAEAAPWFRKAAVSWPSGPLAEDAMSREADAWDKAGRPDDARAAAERYLRRYPSGRHAVEVRRILSE